MILAQAPSLSSYSNSASQIWSHAQGCKLELGHICVYWRERGSRSTQCSYPLPDSVADSSETVWWVRGISCFQVSIIPAIVNNYLQLREIKDCHLQRLSINPHPYLPISQKTTCWKRLGRNCVSLWDQQQNWGRESLPWPTSPSEGGARLTLWPPWPLDQAASRDSCCKNWELFPRQFLISLLLWVY